MRTERNKNGTWNVWMTRDVYREIPRHAPSGLAEVALRLMGDCGLRVAEILDVRPVTTYDGAMGDTTNSKSSAGRTPSANMTAGSTAKRGSRSTSKRT